MLRKSKIVLMDEATSSIDYNTETLIQQSIGKVLKDSTVVTIAHRIKTNINYDRILVLANGEIVEVPVSSIPLSSTASSGTRIINAKYGTVAKVRVK